MPLSGLTHCIYFTIEHLGTGGTTTQTEMLIGTEIGASDSATDAAGQASFPEGFKLIEGDHPLGEDDRYSNGKHVFQRHLLWRAYDNYTWNDDKVRKDIANSYGFPIYRTADSLLWGTGKSGDLYFYVIVDWGGEIFELFSRENDADFATYSKWLITSIREYRKKGKRFIFPRRILK